MNEKEIRHEVFRLSRSLGYVPVTQTDATICPKCGARVLPPIGRPDILWLPKDSRVSEVKVVPHGSVSFPFDSINDDQRDWLDWWRETGHIGYIAIGTLDKPRRLWLVEWGAWKDTEVLLRQYQKSIPVTARPGMRKAITKDKLDMENLLGLWELKRIAGGWSADTHPIEGNRE